MAEKPLQTSMTAYWDARSSDFDQHQGIRHRVQEQAWLGFLSQVVGTEPKVVLDVGTGPGFLAVLLAKLGHRVKGLDLSPGMIDQARKIAANHGLSVTFEVGDAESLPDADGQYDAVLNRNVLWTLAHPEKALADWKRVLKPGSLLVVIDGDWFDEKFSYRAKRFLGHLLVAVIRRRNSWAAEKRLRQGLDGELGVKLPLKAPGNRQTFPKLVAEAGFTDVRLVDLPGIVRAERAGKLLAQRLIQPHKFFAVVARRP